jgi:hypothetical protein
MVIATDRHQARTVLRYVEALIDSVPPLAHLVESKATESIELSNRVAIEVHTASFRAVRGYTVVAAIADECAFWRSDESANPDVEILSGDTSTIRHIQQGVSAVNGVPDALLPVGTRGDNSSSATVEDSDP